MRLLAITMSTNETCFLKINAWVRELMLSDMGNLSCAKPCLDRLHDCVLRMQVRAGFSSGMGNVPRMRVLPYVSVAWRGMPDNL